MGMAKSKAEVAALVVNLHNWQLRSKQLILHQNAEMGFEDTTGPVARLLLHSRLLVRSIVNPSHRRRRLPETRTQHRELASDALPRLWYIRQP